MGLFFGLAVILATCGSVNAQPDAKALPPVIDTAGRRIDIIALSDSTPVVSIRFLGSMCAHCMQQLVYFQEYTKQIRDLNVRVVAFSDNDVTKCREVTIQYAFADDVFSLCSDIDNACSRAFGTTIKEPDGSVTELHGIQILSKRKVLFEHYSTTPYMDIRTLLSLLVKTAGS